jgi:hypothetical protein
MGAAGAAALPALWSETVNGRLGTRRSYHAQHRQVIARAAETQSASAKPSRANETASMISCSQILSALDQCNWHAVREMSSYRVMYP